MLYLRIPACVFVFEKESVNPKINIIYHFIHLGRRRDDYDNDEMIFNFEG